jgi:hypothetical protein
MALSKNIYFITKKDSAWTSANPIIPTGALILVQTVDGDGVVNGMRQKVGIGANYVDTPFIDDTALASKLNHPNGPSSSVIFADGSIGPVDTLSIPDIQESYQLISLDEWVEIKKYSFVAPSFVATPGFSLADKKIGDALSGTFSFTFVKTGSDNLDPTVGGNITVDTGIWASAGDFDLKDLDSYSVTGTNPNINTPLTFTFTLQALDRAGAVRSLQTFSISYKYPIYAGLSALKNIADQNSLTNLQEKLSVDVNNMEFVIPGIGTQSYYHVLVPTDIASSLDIRLQESPGFESANMPLLDTLNLTIGNVTKQYNHYVTDYTSAGLINLLLRNT